MFEAVYSCVLPLGNPGGCNQVAVVSGFFRFAIANRQGALADGLHGLNPRITAHCYTPVKKATSVDLATGKAQRTSVVIKALCISEQIRQAHLGLFLYLIHLKAWRGKEEMALSTLGELWSKGN